MQRKQSNSPRLKWNIRENKIFNVSAQICALLSSARLIVIKIGSAVLADEHGLNLPVLASLACQIARLLQQTPGRRIIIVSSGAVAAGRAVLHKTSTAQSEKQALAAVGQARLMQAWSDSFDPHGIITAQALLTRDDFRIRERFQHATATLDCLLGWAVVPIINENDTVSVHELKFGDNDTLASLLVNLVKADLFISLTSAPGVFADNPEKNPAARIMPVIESIQSLDIDSLCGRGTASGSGGMRSKLLAARRVAQLGVPTLILPGREKDILTRALACEADHPGTLVIPEEKAIPRRKFWMAYQSEPAGEVAIDAGAANALLLQGRSLLPGGILAVQGEFPKGALVRITHNGDTLGVGICAYSSEELARIHGRKRYEIAAILGEANYPDAIHRDNMLIDAAL